MHNRGCGLLVTLVVVSLAATALISQEKGGGDLEHQHGSCPPKPAYETVRSGQVREFRLSFAFTQEGLLRWPSAVPFVVHQGGG